MILSNFSIFGQNATFHHIGIVVEDISEALNSLSIQRTTVVHDPTQKVYVSFICLDGITLELIQPSCLESPVSRTLLKGIRLAHLCYEVVNIEGAVQRGRDMGFIIIAKPVPAIAFENRQIAWLFHKVFGLVELVEKERSP